MYEEDKLADCVVSLNNTDLRLKGKEYYRDGGVKTQDDPTGEIEKNAYDLIKKSRGVK